MSPPPPNKKTLNFIDFYSLRKTFEEKSIRRNSENLEHFPQLYLISIVNTLSLRANPQGKNSESAHDHDDDGTFTTYHTTQTSTIMVLDYCHVILCVLKGKMMTIVSFNHVQSEPICHKIYIL